MESPRWSRREPRKPDESLNEGKLRKEEMRDRAEPRIISKLTEELDLDSETANKLSPLMNEFDIKLQDLRKNRSQTLKLMREELAEDAADPAALSSLIVQFKQTERDMAKARIQRLDALSKILSDEQIAKLIALAPKIKQKSRN